MPGSKLGKWSIGLIIAMPIFFVLGMQFMNMFYESVPSGDTFLEDITNRPLLALSMLAGMASGASAFFTGLTAIVKKKDRGILVYISTILGALTILFLAMEILFPH